MASTMASPSLPPHESQYRSHLSSSLSQGPGLYYSPDFIDFVYKRNHIKQGYNLRWEKVPFISISALVEYWRDKGIESALRDRTNIHYLKDLDGYVRIFSILVYIGKPEFINDFMRHGWMDTSLPMKEGHPFGSNPPPPTMEMIDKFQKYQWEFCPVSFNRQPQMKKRRLDPLQILPIENMKVLSESACSNARTTVRKITFHDGYTDLSPDSTVVFKEYDVQDNEFHRSSWEQEQRVYRAIGPHDCIVKYLGSFEHENRCVVILEYANGGNLQTLFQNQQRFGNLKEVQFFWRALMRLTLGIHHMHHRKPADDKIRRVGCAHRDIKPSNILVFRDDTNLSPENYILKLADFNTSTDLQPVSSTGSGPQDNDGNRTYRSPEASGIHEFEEGDWRDVGFVSDIWSLGCVFSEAFVWLGQGVRGLDAYKTRRAFFLASSPHFPNSGYDQCFHDGDKALPCVREAHLEALPCLSTFDDFSPKIRVLIEEWMLVKRDGRLEARQLWTKFEEMLQDHIPHAPTTTSPNLAGQQNPDIIVTGTDGSFGPVPSNLPEFVPKDSFGITSGTSTRGSHPGAPPTDPNQLRPIMRPYPNPAKLPVTNGSKSPRDKENCRNMLRNFPLRTSPTYPERSVQHNPAHIPEKSQRYPTVLVDKVIDAQERRSKRGTLDGFDRFMGDIGQRHFIFVIDVSVRNHRKQVIQLVKAAEWLLKDNETDLIEVRFTSDIRKRHFQTRSIGRRILEKISNLGKTKDIVWLIEQRLKSTQEHVGCNMESCLNSIFNGEVVRAGYPTSVFVLTDGVWEHRTQSPGGNVEKSINTLVNKMKNLNMTRTDFCVQFVRFGDDDVGKARLVYLDDMAKDNKEEMGDIVDHKSHTEGIWQILIGAVSDANDNDNDSDGDNDNDKDDGDDNYDDSGKESPDDDTGVFQSEGSTSS